MTVLQRSGVSWACHSNFRRDGGNLSVWNSHTWPRLARNVTNVTTSSRCGGNQMVLDLEACRFPSHLYHRLRLVGSIRQNRLEPGK
jgi:hypothetical protein